MSLLYFAVVLTSVAAFEDLQPLESPVPLSAWEKYLEPHLEDLVDYRDNPVLKKYIALANLVDALPTWLEDLFIPLFLPGSEVTIPVNDEIDLKVHLANFSIPLPAKLTIKSITITDLNKFKTLKPIKLMPDTKYTWGGHISLKETTISVETELVVLGKTVTAKFTLPLANPDIQYSVIAAFNRTRLCDLWGEVMESSGSCALWPMFVDETAGISGLNLTTFEFSVSNFDFQIDVQGLGDDLDAQLKEELKVVVDIARPGIIANLPGSISQGIRSLVNTWAVGGLADMHKKSPCSVDQLRPAINVSQVCFLNNAGFALKWSMHNCPAHQVSHQTDPYPADVYECRNVQDLFPGVKPGEIIRVQTEAVAGLHELIDPAFRFQPEANSGGFECDGSTLIYNCGFVSVAPVDADELPEVESVCVMNHGGFAMNFQVTDVNGGGSTGSGTYPINKKQCLDLGQAGPEGNEFKVSVKAVGGKNMEGNRHVNYKKNGYSALYQCKGSTMNYDCVLLVEPKFTIPQVDTVCVNNRGGYAMSFDAKDLRTGNWHGRTGNYPNPQQKCFNIGETSGVEAGDSFEIHANAVAGKEAVADSRVEYKAGGGTATYTCSGSTLGIHCELQREVRSVIDANALTDIVV